MPVVKDYITFYLLLSNKFGCTNTLIKNNNKNLLVIVELQITSYNYYILLSFHINKFYSRINEIL